MGAYTISAGLFAQQVEPMLAPEAEALLDDFNRADGNVAAGGPWVSAAITGPTATDLRVISSQLGSLSGAQSAYTTTGVGGDNCDILVDCPVLSGDFNWWLLLTNPGAAAVSGYRWTISPSGNVSSLTRFLGGTPTVLDAIQFTAPSGSTFWFYKRGPTLALYYKPSGGSSYTMLSGVTDAAPYSPVSGVVGIDLSDTITRLDNLRGGPLVYTYADTGSGTVTASGSGAESYASSDSGAGVTTASGTGVESYASVDSGAGTVTASGAGTESYTAPVVYTDAGSGTVTASGSGTENRIYADDATYYDNVLDVDNPVSHWKLGDPNTAVDRRGLLNLPAVGGPIATVIGLVANNSVDSGNTFAGATQRFGLAGATGRGLPYETTNWTIEVWIKPTTLGSQQIALRRSTQYIVVSGGNSLRFQFDDSVGSQIVTLVSPVVVGTTYHVVGIYDGTNVIAYLNGVEKGRLASTGPLANPDNAPTLGADRLGGFPFTGTIDEVAWYPTALSPARVLAHYNAGVTSVGLATPTVTASGAGVEAYAYADAGSGTVTANGTGVESSGQATSYTDSGSGTLAASGASVESYASTDSASGAATASGASVEAYVYADSAQGTATASGTVAEAYAYVDSAPGIATASGGGAEAYSFPDAGVGAVTASGSGVESASVSDARSGTVTASGTGVEVLAFTDSASGAVTASGSRSESYASADAASGAVAASGGGVESIAFGYVDTGSGTTTVSGSSTEACASADSASGSATTSGSRVESYSASDATSASVTLSGAGVEAYAFGDSRTATITGSGSGAESYASLDAASGVVTVTGFGVEGGSILYVDSASGTCTVSGSAGESAAFADATSGATLVSGTSTESYVAASTRMLALVI